MDLSDAWVALIVESGASQATRYKKWPSVFSAKNLQASYVHEGQAAKGYSDAWGQHLKAAVFFNFSSFRLYLDPQGLPNYDINKNETIADFQKGMYLEYRPKKAANGTPLRSSDNRIIEDKPQLRGYYSFERQLYWEAFHELGLYNIIPVIRESQFAKAQVAFLSRGSQLVFFFFSSFSEAKVMGYGSDTSSGKRKRNFQVSMRKYEVW